MAVETLETHLGELEALHQKVPDKVIKSLSLNKEIVAIYRKKAKKRKAKIAINSAVLPFERGGGVPAGRSAICDIRGDQVRCRLEQPDS